MLLLVLPLPPATARPPPTAATHPRALLRLARPLAPPRRPWTRTLRALSGGGGPAPPATDAPVPSRSPAPPSLAQQLTMGFGQFAATSQFYLFGRRHCTQTGYQAHRAQYEQPDLLESVDLEGKVWLVTGANSGVGKEVAKFGAVHGATVFMVCRNAKRGEAARQEILAEAPHDRVALILADCSLEEDVLRAWQEFCDSPLSGTTPRLDALVCNAGALMNSKTMTREGLEVTFASHLLFGTYLLTTLAIPTMKDTEEARVVVVSSGGMYNSKFPRWERATAMTGDYDGQFAYVFAKRGQVLCCERWAEQVPEVKFMSAHPGWTSTPAVDAAYGENKAYLEPMRTPWEGAEGIAWLCAAPHDKLESGAFYLDRSPQVKHMAGPFFTEGSHTKNTPEQVGAMMQTLAVWSNRAQREPAQAELEGHLLRTEPLTARERPIAIESFMGKWFVVASLPTSFEIGATDCVEEYSYNAAHNRVQVRFTMRTPKSRRPTVLEQRANIVNPQCTRWAICPKFGFYIPLNITYLVLHCADDYSTTIIGVPDRSYVWIMARMPEIDPALYDELIGTAESFGYDPGQINKVTHSASDPPVPPAPASTGEDAGAAAEPEVLSPLPAASC